MNSDPLSAELRALLDAAEAPAPSPHASAALWERVSTSMATVAPVAAPTVSVGAALSGGALMLVVGLGLGFALGRNQVEPPPTAVVEPTRPIESPPPAAEVVVKAEPVTPPSPPRRVAVKPPMEPAKSDASLAKERELVDTARSALMFARPDDALAALEQHRVKFEAGQLAEERESLAIQALVAKGAREDAKARAAAFHRRWPTSLLGPTVDAAFE